MKSMMQSGDEDSHISADVLNTVISSIEEGTNTPPLALEALKSQIYTGKRKVKTLRNVAVSMEMLHMEPKLTQEGVSMVGLTHALMSFVDPMAAIQRDRLIEACNLLATQYKEKGDSLSEERVLRSIKSIEAFGRRRKPHGDCTADYGIKNDFGSYTSASEVARAGTAASAGGGSSSSGRRRSRGVAMDSILTSIANDSVRDAVEEFLLAPEDIKVANALLRTFLASKAKGDFATLDTFLPVSKLKAQHPNSLPIALMSGHASAANRKYRDALERYLDAYMKDASQPLTCLCLAVLLIFIAANQPILGRQEALYICIIFSSAR